MPILIVVLLSLSFYFFITPEKLITIIGVDNAYLLIFLLALIGGLTTFSGIPYHLILITLALGGLNPFVLGMVTASGVALGDSTSYFLGHNGSAFIPTHFTSFFKKLNLFIMNYPKLFPVFCFLYGSLIPLSNDFIAITSGLLRYPFWKVIIPLGLGNLVFNISLAYLATHAYDFLQGIYF